MAKPNLVCPGSLERARGWKRADEMFDAKAKLL